MNQALVFALQKSPLLPPIYIVELLNHGASPDYCFRYKQNLPPELSVYFKEPMSVYIREEPPQPEAFAATPSDLEDDPLKEGFDIHNPQKILKKFKTPRAFWKAVQGFNFKKEAVEELQQTMCPLYYQNQIENKKWFFVLSVVSLSLFYVVAMLFVHIYRYFFSGYVEKHEKKSNLYWLEHHEKAPIFEVQVKEEPCFKWVVDTRSQALLSRSLRP